MDDLLGGMYKICTEHEIVLMEDKFREFREYICHDFENHSTFQNGFSATS